MASHLDLMNALRMEWLKQRRSAAAWLTILAAGFVPAIMLLVRLFQHKALPKLYQQPDFWVKHWNMAWESTAFIMLPFLTMFLVSLIVQIEFRNNTWKQVHATAQSTTTVFFAKLAIITAWLIVFMVCFNIAVFAVVLIPAVFMPMLTMPTADFPWQMILSDSTRFLIATTPILTLQYALSLQCRNFIVPLGIGGAMWLAAVGTISWQHVYVIPYVYPALEMLLSHGGGLKRDLPLSIENMSIIVALAFTALGAIAFSVRRDREY